MTKAQWDKHTDHLNNHITWPATKEQVVAACNGEDVEPAVLEDVKQNLPDGTYENAEEVMKVLVKE